MVEADRYLLELVRSLHLNPLRAGGVPTLAALARSPWSGHSALLGRAPRPWQATTAILGHFAARAREGAAYLWCRVAGQSGRVLAAALGLSHQAVYAAATRGERAAARWQAVWKQLQ